jgi:hypothetical protein
MLQVSVSNVSSVFSDVYCKFIYLDVAYVSHICCNLYVCYLCLQWFFKRFSCVFQVFQKHVLSVSSIFRRMLQVLHLDVSKVDQSGGVTLVWACETQVWAEAC